MTIVLAFTGKYCEKDQSVVYLCEETREKIANATLCDFTIPSPNCYVKDDYDRTLLCHNKSKLPFHFTLSTSPYKIKTLPMLLKTECALTNNIYEVNTQVKI